MLVGCPGSRPSVKKTIISHLATPLRIEDVRSSLPDAALVYSLTEVESGKQFALDLTNTSLEPGRRYSGKVELTTDAEKAKIIPILVRLYTLPQVRVEPDQIRFDMGRHQRPGAKEVTVSFCDPGFNIGELYYDKELFSVEVRKDPGAPNVILTVSPKASELPMMNQKYPLLIETNVPKSKYLLVELIVSMTGARSRK